MNGRQAKKLRRMVRAREQQMAQQFLQAFWRSIPKMSLRTRCRLAWRIVRATSLADKGGV